MDKLNIQHSDCPRGFTLVELLLVVSVISILLVATLMSVKGQTVRAMDIKRKADVYNLRKSFEDYNNDHDAFPAQQAVDNCDSADLAPYLAKIPCDPVSKSHYGYFPSVTGGYRICAKLADTTDPAIAAVGCGGPSGCGLGEGYNYCLAAGVTASAVGTIDQIGGSSTPTPGGPTPTATPTPTPGGPMPTPTPTPTPGGPMPTATPTPMPTATPTPYLNPTYHWVCTNGGACNWYDNPSSPQHRCPISWPAGCPPGACAIATNRCAD